MSLRAYETVDPGLLVIAGRRLPSVARGVLVFMGAPCADGLTEILINSSLDRLNTIRPNTQRVWERLSEPGMGNCRVPELLSRALLSRATS